MFMGETRGNVKMSLFPPCGEEGEAGERGGGQQHHRTPDTVSCHWRVFLVVFPFYFSIIWVTYAPAKYSLLAFIFHCNQYYLQYIKQSIRAWHLLSFWRKTMPVIRRGITTKKGPREFKFSLGDFLLRTKFSSGFFSPINKIQPVFFFFFFFFFNSLPLHLPGHPPLVPSRALVGQLPRKGAGSTDVLQSKPPALPGQLLQPNHTRARVWAAAAPPDDGTLNGRCYGWRDAKSWETLASPHYPGPAGHSDLPAMSPGPHILSPKSPCNTDPTGQAQQGSQKAWELPAKIKTKEGNRMLMKTDVQARCGESSRTPSAKAWPSGQRQPVLCLPRDQGRSSRSPADPLLPRHPQPGWLGILGFFFSFKLSFRKSDLNIQSGKTTNPTSFINFSPYVSFMSRSQVAGEPPALPGKGAHPHWLVCVWTFGCRTVKPPFTKINSKTQNNLLKSFAASF